MKLTFLCCLIILSCNFTFSQSTVSGFIKDSIGEPIPFANIYLISIGDQIVLNFTSSDEDGKYLLDVYEKGYFQVRYKALSYSTEILMLEFGDENHYLQDIVLREEAYNLEEVLIEAERPIIIKRDTIIFDAKFFAQGDEEVVEDLLKKIPGLQIDSEGNIRIGNKGIEKVMIDGDDFFERGYKMLTKNMPANLIKKVEIYEKYSNNKHLKGVEKSDKVALNLTLDKEETQSWFGNLSAGKALFTKQYLGKANLMSFRKKAKYYFIANLNNIGIDATGDINDLINTGSPGEPGDLGVGYRASNLHDLNFSLPQLPSTLTNFNNFKMISLNGIFDISNNTKIKALGLANWDENDFFSSGYQTFRIENLSFTNTENYQLQQNSFSGFLKLDLTHDFSETETLVTTGKINLGKSNTKRSLNFNEESINERLKQTNNLLDQKLIYTNKIKDNKVFILSGRFIDEKIPEIYKNDKPIQSLFSNFEEGQFIEQKVENRLQYTGAEAHLLDRKTNGSLLEVKLGIKYSKEWLNYTLRNMEVEIQGGNTESFNKIHYSIGTATLGLNYNYKLGNLSINGGIKGYHQIIDLSLSNLYEKENPSYLIPELGFNWKINEKNSITGRYNYNITNPGILNLYDNYLLTDYRTLTKGAEEFEQMKASKLFLNYSLGNWGGKFFANTFLIYNKDYDYFSNNSFITANSTFNEQVLLNDREFLSINSTIDRYINFISSNLKLKGAYSLTKFENIVNERYRQVNSSTLQYGAELRTGFNGFLNFHLGGQFTINNVKSTNSFKSKDVKSFIDFNFAINRNFSAFVKAEHFHFSASNGEDQNFFFLDFNSRYTIKENKLILYLSANNLLNTSTFRNYFITDTSVSSTEYRLLPRYLMLRVDYRF